MIGTDDPHALADAAEQRAARGDRYGAAAAYDRAFGLAPHDARIARARQQLLDTLAVNEHGLRFRYVPAGPRVIGSEHGDPDERPVHPVTLQGFWLTDTPVSWTDFCRILGWTDPPEGMPPEIDEPEQTGVPRRFFLYEENKIRLQYCEDLTVRARDWHAHAGMTEPFGDVPRAQDLPPGYRTKPMVSVSWQEAGELVAAMDTPGATYRLPTEAEWEVAARGGLVGARYAWGDELPTVDICDVDRFDQFSIVPPRALPPNGYGLYGMCGGVWEWTADWYDALYYAQSPIDNPAGPHDGQQKVIRGGSWTDCPEVATVSFRASRGSGLWRDTRWGGHMTANIGFRLCRVSASGIPS